MALKLLGCLLAVACTNAAALPIEEVVDQLQTFLTAPEQSLVRHARSSDSAWDKSLDIGSLGLLLQIKYNNPSKPLEGGRAHVKFPGRRFIRNAPFDDVELNIEFNGGSAIDGIFDMKVDYKFIQKYTFLADRLREGSFFIYRKLEGGMWKSRMMLEDNTMEPIDISMESDRMTKLHAIFNYESDNQWELKADRVPGKSTTFEFILNGQKYTGVATVDRAARKLSLMLKSQQGSYSLNFELNPEGNFGLHVTGDVMGAIDAKAIMQPDFKKGDIVFKYREESYAFMTLNGQAKIAGVIPQLVDYVVKYNIKYDGQDHQGKAKLKYDGTAASKKFQASFAPQSDRPVDFVAEVDMSRGVRYMTGLKIDGAEVEKREGDWTWTNDASKFEMKNTDKFMQTKENPLLKYNTKYWTYGRQMLQAEKVRTIFFDKVQKNKLFNKMRVEEKMVYDGKTWYEAKYDSTTPKISCFVTFLPATSPEMYTMTTTIEYLPVGGFKLEYETLHATRSTTKGEIIFDIKKNNAATFEMEGTQKVAMTEASPFYGVFAVYAGRYGKNVEGKIHIFVNKKDMSIAFVPMVKYSSVLMVDGKKIRDVELDTTQAKRTLRMFYEPDVFSQSYSWEQSWEIQPEAVVLHMDYKRGTAAVFNYNLGVNWANTAAKFELNYDEKVDMSEQSAFYSLGKFMHGRYWKKAARTVKMTYDNQNKNILFGKMFFNDIISLDDQKYREVKLDTQATPYTLTWYQPTSGHLLPSALQVIGQPELKVTAWHTPGQELKVETNLEQVHSLRITTQGITRKFELNGKELLSVDFDTSAKTISQTTRLPSGQEMTVTMAWPKTTVEASNLEFGVTITPDRKIEGKFGWEGMGWGKDNKVVYVNVEGRNPMIGEYKVQRRGEYERTARKQYQLKWTGHDEVTKGYLAAFSPIETNMRASLHTGTMDVDAKLFKTIGGRKWGVVLANDKFEIIAGRS